MADRGHVSLRLIDDANRDAVVALAVSAEQTGFVDSVAESLAEAAQKPEVHPWFRAIYADDGPVGFVMITDGVPPGHDEFRWPYFLWRLLVDARYQRRGYGSAALDQVVEHVLSRPDASELVTSAVPGQGSPMTFYERHGFRATGEVLDGELVYVLPLRTTS